MRPAATPHRIQKQRRDRRLVWNIVFSPVIHGEPPLDIVGVRIVDPAIETITGQQPMGGISRVGDGKIIGGGWSAIIHGIWVVGSCVNFMLTRPAPVGRFPVSYTHLTLPTNREV